MSLNTVLMELVGEEGKHSLFAQASLTEKLNGKLNKGICLALSILFLERNYVNWLRKVKSFSDDEGFFDKLIEDYLFVDSYMSDYFPGFTTQINVKRVEDVALRVQTSHLNRIDRVNQLIKKGKDSPKLGDTDDKEGHRYEWMRETFERLHSRQSYIENHNPAIGGPRGHVSPGDAKFPLKPASKKSTSFGNDNLTPMNNLLTTCSAEADPRFLIFTTRKHAMAIFIAGTGSPKKKYKFFDPNGGIAVLASVDRLKEVLAGYIASEEFTKAYLAKGTTMYLFPFEPSGV